MFILAVMGNVTYSLGIFLYSTEEQFLIAKLPWLVGSIGTLCFDFTIFTQFIIYGCFGKPCGHGDARKLRRGSKVTDDEEEPLIRRKDGESGLPCFGSHGNIQGAVEDEEDEWKVSGRTRNGYGNNKD
jgi:hypothetical protein